MHAIRDILRDNLACLRILAKGHVERIIADRAIHFVQPSMDEMYSAVRYNALDVAFGKDAETGEIITQNIPNGVHFKLVGFSGFGKSCLAGALLDIATKRNDPDHLRIAMLDLEYKTSRLFEQLPHVLEVQNGTRRVRLHAKDADEVARHLPLFPKKLYNPALPPS